MTRAVSFTQAQVRRAVKAAESVGVKVARVRVYPDGSIEVGENETPSHSYTEERRAESWDDLQ